MGFPFYNVGGGLSRNARNYSHPLVWCKGQCMVLPDLITRVSKKGTWVSEISDVNLMLLWAWLR